MVVDSFKDNYLLNFFEKIREDVCQSILLIYLHVKSMCEMTGQDEIREWGLKLNGSQGEWD